MLRLKYPHINKTSNENEKLVGCGWSSRIKNKLHINSSSLVILALGEKEHKLRI